MPKNIPLANARKKKTINACQWCRSRKIKCSGQQPCRFCSSKRYDCVFEERGKKVVVSENYLQELQNIAVASESRSLRSSVQLNSRDAYGVSFQPEFHSPLATAQQNQQDATSPKFFRANLGTTNTGEFSRLQMQSSPHSFRGQHVISSDRAESCEDDIDSVDSPDAIGDRYRRLGHSSSWSFSRRIRSMVSDGIGGLALHDIVVIKDGAYGIPWRQNLVDLSGLEIPTEDYAEYLTNTVYFTFGRLYYLFDKKRFVSKLHQFYIDQDSGRIIVTNLWHVQMLAILALGKLILAREPGRSGPAGAVYFARAVEALPDAHRLSQDYAMSIELLLLFSLLAQAMDMRLAAHSYIGQAARLAVNNGYPRIFDQHRLTLEEYEHRSKLWWTIYVIDRKLSSLVGVAPGFSDKDIAVAMPNIESALEKDLGMAFHVEISSQLGNVLNVVYSPGTQQHLGSKFVAAIHSILQRQEILAAQLNSRMKIESPLPTETISRTAATLHLLHHQCNILATRPMLFFLLEKKMTTADGALTLSDAVVALLRVCVESSLQVLKIVETLRSNKLADTILPHDLDALFAAAFVLVVVDIITPAAAKSLDLREVFAFMDEFILKGIIIAEPYKKDLEEINYLRQRLQEMQRREPPYQPRGSHATLHSSTSLLDVTGKQTQMDHTLEQDLIWSWGANGTQLGVLDPETLQSAIHSLNFDFLDPPTSTEMDENAWMW